MRRMTSVLMNVVSICLMSTSILLNVLAQQNVLCSGSGNVTVILGDPLTLSWTHRFLDSDIDSCYYQFTGKYVNEFLGWRNKDRERVNYAENHHGWEFINEKMPCQDGIRREDTAIGMAGQYKLHVVTNDGRDHGSQRINVTVVTGSELLYTITIDKTEVKGSVTHQSAMPTLQIEDHGLTSLSISLGKEFPMSNITLSVHFENSSHVKTLQSCLMSVYCSGKFTTRTDLVQISADIVSGIQGFEVVRVQQPVLVIDESVIVAATAGGKKWKTALIVVLITIPLIGGIIGGLIYFLKLRKRNTNNTTEEGRKLLKTELESTKSVLSIVQEEITDLRIQYTVLTEQKNTLEESNQILSRKLETSEKASKDTQLKLNALEDDYCKLQYELEEKKSECAALLGTLYNANSTKAENDKMIHSLQERITTRKQDYEKIYVENEGLKEHISRLKDDLQVKHESMEQLYETINSLKNEKLKLQNDVTTLSAKQKSKGKQPDTNITPRISSDPLVHKNPAFWQTGSTDSVQQTGIMSRQKDDQRSIESGKDALTMEGLLKDQVFDEKHVDPSGDVATTLPNIPQETPDVARRDEPTLRVVKQTGVICVQKDKTMFLSVAIEDNLLVKATWYHGKSELWRNHKYKTGSDGYMYYLLVSGATKSDGGYYTCHLKAVGSTLEATCVIHVMIKDNVDFKFDMKPKDVSCKIGSPFSIKASMKHQDFVDFIWLKDGIIIPGDFIETAHDRGSVSTTLSIDHSSDMDAGKYYIFALAGELQNYCTFRLMFDKMKSSS